MAKLSTTSVFGDLLVDGMINGNVTGSLTGNASTATSATTATSAGKWTTARTITIGSKGKSVDGSGNVSWTLSEIGAAASGHTHNYAGSSSAGGAANSVANNLSIQLNGGTATTFNGSAAKTINITPSSIGAAASSHGTHVTYSTTAPKVAGTASVGSESSVARGDHVHAAQTSVSGNAGTATKLSTARTLTIGSTGKSFDGSANVSWSLSEIGAAASNHKHGLLHDNFTVELANTTTDNGWSMINSSYNGYLLKSIRFSASVPPWAAGGYGAGIAFGGGDTKGVMSMQYSSPLVKFAGGNGTKPVWNIGITGTSGTNYNLNDINSLGGQLTVTNGNIGTLSSLQTSNKGNLVAAINEVFQSGANVKQQLVDALVAKGISASTSESWDDLIDKLNDLNGGLDIISATTLPSSGKHDQICVITNNPTNNFLITTDFNDTQSSSAICIYLGDAEDVLPNSKLTITKGNITNIYYFNRICQQNKRLSSYHYANNQWNLLTKANIPVYENGSFPSEDILGVSPVKTSTSAVYIEGNEIFFGTANYSIRGFTFPNIIDFSSYHKVTIVARYVPGYVVGCLYVASMKQHYTSILDIGTNTLTSTYAYNWVDNAVSSATETVLTYDISSFTGSGYLGIVAGGSRSNFYIREIILE